MHAVLEQQSDLEDFLLRWWLYTDVLDALLKCGAVREGSVTGLYKITAYGMKLAET